MRKDLAPLGYVTTIWLGMVIGVSVLGASLVLNAGAGGQVTIPLVDLLWVAITGLTSIGFLGWLSRARRNAATYEPGTAGPYRQWTVGGWLCPVINLWIPYLVMAGVLRVTAQREPDSQLVLAAPPARPAGTGVLRVWCVAWHGMWPAFLTAIYDTHGSEVSWLAELVFLLLSIGAAACMIGIVRIVTRGQAEREADSYVQPSSVPRAAPAWFWVTAVALIVTMITFARHLPVGHLAAFRDLFVP